MPGTSALRAALWKGRAGPLFVASGSSARALQLASLPSVSVPPSRAQGENGLFSDLMLQAIFPEHPAASKWPSDARRRAATWPVIPNRSTPSWPDTAHRFPDGPCAALLAGSRKQLADESRTATATLRCVRGCAHCRRFAPPGPPLSTTFGHSSSSADRRLAPRILACGLSASASEGARTVNLVGCLQLRCGEAARSSAWARASGGTPKDEGFQGVAETGTVTVRGEGRGAGSPDEGELQGLAETSTDHALSCGARAPELPSAISGKAHSSLNGEECREGPGAAPPSAPRVSSKKIPAEHPQDVGEGGGLPLGSGHRGYSSGGREVRTLDARGRPGRPRDPKKEGAESMASPMRHVASLLLERLHVALTTLPTAAACAQTLAMLALGGLPMALLATWAGAFSLPHARLELLVLLKAIFVPCLAEELLWRGLLIPQVLFERTPSEEVLFWGILSTSLYVVAHPLLAYAVRPAAFPLFSHPGFLACCAIIGAMCVAAYRRSGSLWTAVFIHWTVVAVWLTLGGRQKAPFM